MTTNEAYIFYLATKLHFTSDYDIKQANARIKCKPNAVEKRNDKKIFEHLCSKYKTPKDILRFYFANFSVGESDFIYNYEKAEYNYKNWVRIKESITKIFSDDIELILDSVEGMENKEDSIFKVVDNEPLLFKLLVSKSINIQTASILNDYANFIPSWETSSLIRLWRPEILRIKKSRTFIVYDDKKIRPLWERFYDDIKKTKY